MRSWITAPVKVDPSRAFRGSRSVGLKIAARRSLLSRARRFIVQTDWERRYLGHRLIDRCCLAVAVLAAAFFLPRLAWILLRQI
jgi:hypothetical protein